MALGGLHVTSLPDEAARSRRQHLPRPGRGHLAAVPRRLPRRAARSPSTARTVRTLDGLPPIRRDLIKRHLYLVPNSIVVSRGCPHTCDFCYKEAFFEGGKGFYTQTGGRGPRGDRAPARPPPLLPGRPPVRRRPLRGRALRGDAGDGPRLAGRGDGQFGPEAGAPREGGGCGPAQPLRRLRDAEPGGPARAAQGPEPPPRLRRGGPPPARPRA